jgi:Fe2+ transport system protein B
VAVGREAERPAARTFEQLTNERTLRMSVIGFIVGCVVGLIFYVVATALLVFQHSNLVFGLIAVLIILAFTFRGVNLRV